MRNILLLIAIFWVTLLNGQNMGVFSDYQNRFWVFDDGIFRQLEYLPVMDYQVGDHCIGYTTNGNNLKAYSNHIDYDLSYLVSSYTVTNNLLSYKVGSQLYVFENGAKTLLSKFVGNYVVNDSLVAFFDTESYLFQVYYKGKKHKLEDGLMYNNASSFWAGENTLAYVDAYENFKIFYQEETYDILQGNSVDAKLGLNIVAFIDPITEFLQVFYKGETLVLESFIPLSYQVGYNKVAYIDNVGDFKLFDDGEIHTITNFEPDAYMLKHNMVTYHQQEQLWAFYEGENYLIENYLPAKVKIYGNNIVYTDLNGYLNIFEAGERKVLSFEKINDFEVMRNVIIYNEGMNTTKVYYQGNTYSKE